MCALLLRPYLQYVTALVGINSLLISVLLPLLFYVQLRRRAMGWPELVAFSCVLACTALVTAYMSFMDVQEFVEELDGGRRGS